MSAGSTRLLERNCHVNTSPHLLFTCIHPSTFYCEIRCSMMAKNLQKAKVETTVHESQFTSTPEVIALRSALTTDTISIGFDGENLCIHLLRHDKKCLLNDLSFCPATIPCNPFS
ncbi:hypothetical protein MPTK1_2g08520 [Marchantia polymorpha subsp. ruderalis]|uniref:Uncharacterized protein n=1 Tax=Marchantia polymorpha TaxID=3197 RepID=A0A2R6XGX6_MARPO|nr:hypothetical protein MARPO_0015s0137 [Marchantia polymorpha]BBN01575.1 hypothetical protein Mp_2g08520 [Marchantia polymorpha subsp. ruderalis]|eukprot:PTQ45342.1 hypothetical protein MARPO_0015s0137 [Marchantia polymorpha]